MRLCTALRRLLILVLMLLPSAYAQTDLGGFTIRVPPGWTSAPDRDGDGTKFSPAGQGSILVNVWPLLSAQDDPTRFMESLGATLARNATVLKQEAAQTQTMPGGNTLSLKTLLVRTSGGGTLSYVAALVQGQKEAVLMLLFAPSDAAAQQYLPAFTSLLTSVRFTAGSQAAGGQAAGGQAAGGGGSPGLGRKQPLPEVRPMNAAQFIAAGGDPERQVIPDEFRCYLERDGDGLTSELVVQVLPGGGYRTPYGGGTLRVVKDGSLSKLQGTGGPLDGSSGYLHFDNDGQSLSISRAFENVSDRSLSFECYQRGPRENAALFSFKLKTPKVGAYSCVVSDGTGRSGGNLQLLSGGQYTLAGQSGRYAVNYRERQSDDTSTVSFTGGSLGGLRATYQEDGGGLRQLSLPDPPERLFGRGAEVECRALAQPTPRPSPYGAARAPAPPRGSGGLNGAWVHSRAGNLILGLQVGPNFTSSTALNSECSGNICWEYAFFDVNGYAYRGEPEVSADEADCTRTYPNGLPVCEVYRVQGGTIQFGRDKPEPFKQTASTLKIGGWAYSPLPSLSGLKISGVYRSTTVWNSVFAIGGNITRAALVLSAQGQFTLDRSSDTNLAGAGYVLGASNTAATTSGMYAFQGNTLTLTFRDGRTVKLFAALVTDERGKLSLTMLRLGGVTYIQDDGKGK